MPSVGNQSGEGTHTFAYESALPKLPLPELSNTFEQLKQSLNPLYCAGGFYKGSKDPEQWDTFSKCIKEFLHSELAEKLQAKLAEYDASSDCYLDNLHLDINNNSAREPEDDVLPRNPFLLLGDDIMPSVSQVERSAVLLHAALRFIAALRQEVLSPDMDGASASGGKDHPLAMSPYLNLFGTTRCPVFAPGEVEAFDLGKPFKESDLESSWSSDSSDDEGDESPEPGTFGDTFTRHGITIKRYPDSKHVLVISKGQYYTVDVLDAENNVLYNPSHLTTILEHILQDSSGDRALRIDTALGSLTTHSFRNWKYSRKRLQRKFPRELRLIDSALFVLVLDQSDPGDEGEPMAGVDGLQILGGSEEGGMGTASKDLKRFFYGTSIIDDNGHQVGSCISRWYDKLQMVVTKDAQASVIWDCFTCDGSTVLRFVSETYTESILRLAREVNLGDPKFSLWPSIGVSSVTSASNKKALELDPSIVTHKIKWDFSDILNTHIHLSETKLADLISKYDMVRLSVPYGQRTANRWGVTSDSMIQVALQVAHYALYGRMAFGFEPVSMRSFKNSRSCFVNIQNDDMLEFCEEFISGSLDDSNKLNSFMQTCKRYTERVRRTKLGSGFEKHFNAMRFLFKFSEHYGFHLDSKDKELGQAVFENPLLAPLLAPELLAANCGNAATSIFAITPAQPRGFGIGYTIKDDHCDLTVTSQYRQGARLMFMLNWVLIEVTRMWQKAAQGSKTRNKGYKVNPLVDKLYELDNALMHPQKRHNKVIKGYGFFDLQPHWDSTNTSAVNSANNSSLHLSSMGSSSKLHGISPVTYSSIPLSVPTESEKRDTGFEITQVLDRERGGTSDTKPDTSNDGGTESSPSVGFNRRSNVIKSKFEIDFERGGVGKKVAPIFH